MANRRTIERLERLLRDDIEAGRSHGVAMLVSQHGEVIFDFVAGHADPAAERELTRDSVFITMSTAKPFTSYLALSLVERGLLRLHAPVAELIPELAVPGMESLSLYHLLTHTSGIMMSFPPVGPEILADVEQLTRYLATQLLESPPGERVNYSMICGHSVIATLCLRAAGHGRDYPTMLAEDVFLPLGMTNTSLGPRPDLVERVCPLRTTVGAETNFLTENALLDLQGLILRPGSAIPAAGMLTTIDDLHRFTEMLRRGGELDGARIVSPAMIDYSTHIFTGEMRNRAWDIAHSTRGWQPFPANLGLGVHVRGDDVRPGPFGTLNSPRTFGHFGSGSTGTWVDPGYGLSFSFLSAGLWEDSRHLERTGVLSDLVVSAVTSR